MKFTCRMYVHLDELGSFVDPGGTFLHSVRCLMRRVPDYDSLTVRVAGPYLEIAAMKVPGCEFVGDPTVGNAV